jgi:hypothetical protein
MRSRKPATSPTTKKKPGDIAMTSTTPHSDKAAVKPVVTPKKKSSAIRSQGTVAPRAEPSRQGAKRHSGGRRSK